MNFIEKIDTEIEKYFHASGAKDGFENLSNDFKQYTSQRNEEFIEIKQVLEQLSTESTQTEISIQSEKAVRDACFQQIGEFTLIGAVSKNFIYIFQTENSQNSKINLLSQHSIQFDIQDNPNQYSSYPKHKQKIVNFVKNYRESVFPNLQEDLYSCDFIDFFKDKNVYTGVVAGGVTGFIHFVEIQSSTIKICYQAHGDTIFDVKSLNRDGSCYDYQNIVVSAGKDGCVILSHLLKQEKLVQFKDFLSSSPMSQITCIDIDMTGDRIFSACGDGTVQVWQISEQVKKVIQSSSNICDFIKIEKALYSYQVHAQEDIMHTVQVIQCCFYGRLLLYLTSQGYITLGTFIEPHMYKNSFKMRKFDKDNTGKTLKLFQIANFDLQQKVNNYDRIMYVDQLRGLLWIGKNDSIYCFDLKERRQSDIDYNYSKCLLKFNVTVDSNIQKIFFSDNYRTMYILTDSKQLIKYDFLKK